MATRDRANLARLPAPTYPTTRRALIARLAAAGVAAPTVASTLAPPASARRVPAEAAPSAQEGSGRCGGAMRAASATPPTSPAADTPVAGAVAETNVRFGETDALLWRAGGYGAVLVHGAAYDAASWRPQAEAIAAAGVTALALEQISPEDVLAGIRFLEEQCGIVGAALIGASAGAGAALAAAGREPEAIDQLIILSGSGDVSGLGDQPKLFVASEGEGLADATRRMAEDAPGGDNEALILPGDAHAQAIFETEHGDDLLEAILDRLTEHLAEAG